MIGENDVFIIGGNILPASEMRELIHDDGALFGWVRVVDGVPLCTYRMAEVTYLREIVI